MADRKSYVLPIILIVVGLAALALGFWIAQKRTPTTPVAAVEAPLAPATEQTQGQTAIMDAAALTSAQATDPSMAPPPAAPIMAETTSAEPPPLAPQIAPEGRFIGRQDAPVQIIEFASLTCSHCADFHVNRLPELRARFIDTGKVRIEFRPFPLNKPAFDATKILSCLPESQYYAFTSLLFETQSTWAFTPDYLTHLRQNAKLAGLSDVAFDACLQDTAFDEKFAAQMKADQEKYGIESTPTFILNDGKARVVGVASIETFAQEIDALIATPAP